MKYLLASLLLLGACSSQDSTANVHLPYCGQKYIATWELTKLTIHGDTAFVTLVCSEKDGVQ